MCRRIARRPVRDRQRLRARLAGQPLQAQHQLGVDGRAAAPSTTTGRPASTRCTRRRERQRALAERRAVSTRLEDGHARQPTEAAAPRVTPRSPVVPDCGHDARQPAARRRCSSHGEGIPEESFDVEPPYEPDDEALAAVEKYDDRFLDRELSWLRFNQRVLELAEDRTLPLLERTRFLAIFTSNLDEFFMVRVAGLKRRIAAGVAVPAASRPDAARGARPDLGDDPRARRAAGAAVPRRDRARRSPTPGIELVRWDDLDREEQKHCKRLFKERVFPVLTPLAVDPAHPFPYISGLSLNLAVLVRNPKTGKEHFARVKVPPIFARFVPVGNQRFVPLEDVIGEHLKRLFPGMEVLEVHTFRVTRNEDLEVEEDDAENLLAALEKELLRRRFGPPVRLEVEESIAPAGARPARLRARRRRGGGVPAPGPARPARPARHRRPDRARS